MFKKTRIILSLLFIAAVLCVGCSFAQESEANGTAKLGVMDAIGELGLTEFSAAIEGVALTDTLNNQGVLVIGPGSFVIFAPSDAAFAEATDIDMNAVKENAT